jgi:hypothetical protein
MQTTLVQAARPEDLKDKIDDLISQGRIIVQVLELSNKTHYIIIHKAP